MVSIVPLTGGLGNQLFQYAFALHLEASISDQVSIDCSIGRPRLIGASVALLGIKIENERMFCHFNNTGLNNFYSKIYGWNLSNNLSGAQRYKIEQITIKMLSVILLGIRYQGLFYLSPSSDLGFDNSLKDRNKAIYFGYFQTFRYASKPNVYNQLMAMTPKMTSKKYSNLQKEIKRGRNILLHIRLTDYLVESKFGIPSLEYYREALETIEELIQIDSIWVISDDTDGAKSFIRNLDVRYRMIHMNQSGISDLEVWDLMRDFSGYIISNSSYAWWAAFLRRQKSAPVISPDPWFLGMNGPNDLIPEKWIKVSSK